MGLVGLPNAGKSSLFNALTGSSVPVATHPFSTTSSSTGTAKVPDARLEALAAMSKSRNVVPATLEVVDVAGLAKGAAGGEGLGNRFLGGLREMDALCLVLRSFHHDEAAGEEDPLAALGELELELVLADHASLDGQLVRRRKMARADRSLAAEVAGWEEALAVLERGIPLYRSGLDDEVRSALRGAFLLTNKPVLAVVNVGEDQLDELDKLVSAVEEEFEGGPVVGLSVQLEAEVAQLEPGERAELLGGLGLGEGAVPTLARAAYGLLGRRTFLTTGEKESRAWTFRAGAKAPECAGVIHSDLQRGFIRAEVITTEELLALGSWTAARAAGRLRVEGKDYEVADGDVLEIRFNV